MKASGMGFVAVIAALVLAASEARAADMDIAGKWGIGAGVFGGGGEVSLIRGHSQQSAWLFDVRVSRRELDLESEGLLTIVSSPPGFNQVNVSVGPGYRRFVGANGEIAPYWDARVQGIYSRSRNNSGSFSQTRTDTGAGVAFSFGLEYFTPWHFSVAAHSTVAQFSWTHERFRQSDPFGGSVYATGHADDFSIGLSPAIYVRGYF